MKKIDETRHEKTSVTNKKRGIVARYLREICYTSYVL